MILQFYNIFDLRNKQVIFIGQISMIMNLGQNNNQVRQHLVQQNIQQNNVQQVLPVPNQIIIQPQLLNPRQFPPQNQVQNAILRTYLQRSLIPMVPISGYKYFLEICMFFGCLIQIIFFRSIYIHFIWMTWYVCIGYARHQVFYRNIRFWGQFFNLILWISTNIYVFGSDNKNTVFPFLIILVNLDYYFIGAGLFLTYFCFITYMIWQCIANCRLKIIERKLQKRKSILIDNLLKKFMQNEKKYTNAPSTVEASPLSGQEIQFSQRFQKLSQKQNIQNICPICLCQLMNEHKGKQHKAVRLDCSHRYHYGCINQWIQLDNINCPVCRRSMIQN